MHFNLVANVIGLKSRTAPLLTVFACLSILGGCRTFELKPTGRAASDQFLISSCVEGVMEKFTVGPKLSDAVVDLKVVGLGNDREYIAEVLKSWVVQSGGTIAADTKTSPTMILNLMVQSAGSDSEVAKWVFPIPIPVPSFQSGVTMTYLEFFKVSSQIGRCHLWAYATDPATNLLFRQEPVYVQHYITNREVLGFTLGRTSDISELDRNPGVLSVDSASARPEPTAPEQ